MIWITGNKGLLGSELSHYLTSMEIPHVGTDLDVDIRDTEQLKNFIQNKKLTYVINCAAYSAVDLAEENREEVFAINHLGVKNLVSIANELDIPLIHFSSEFVFDGTSNSDYIETDKVNPQTVYGESKVLADAEIIENCKKYFILRPSWLYGKYKDNFVYMILNLAYKEAIIEIVDEQTGSPTNCLDLSKGVVKIIESNSEAYGLYHFSNEDKTDWYEYATTIFTKAMLYNVLPRDIQANVRIYPITTSEHITPAPRPANSYLNSSKFTNIFGMHIPPWKESLIAFVKILKPIRRGFND